MSLAGHSRPNWAIRATSALPPIATKLRTSREVCSVPISEVAILFNNLVGLPNQRRREGDPESLRGLEVYSQFKADRLLHREFTGFVPLRILATYPADRRYISAKLG